MAKKNTWGGKRKGAGRPTEVERLNIRKIMDKHIDADIVMDQLLQRIESGDHRAIELWLKYRAGLPKQEIDLSVDGQMDQNVTLKGLVSFDDE